MKLHGLRWLAVILICMAALLSTLFALQTITPPGQAAVADAPSIQAVQPEAAPDELDTTITITGTGFTPALSGTQVLTAPVVRLGEQLLDSVWITTTLMTATVPWGLAPGAYDLSVENPDGGSASLPSGFTVQASFGVWSSSGLYGGNAFHIVPNPVNPEILYASIMVSGLYRSSDGGASWEISDVNAFPERVAFDAANPQVIYGGGDGAIQRSNDGGTTWTRLPHTRLCIDAVRPFTHPTTAGTVYFAVSCGTGDSGAGVFKSINYGATWTPLSGGLVDRNVTWLAFNPDDAQTMYASTSSGDVYLSTNGGGNWTLGAHVSDHVERLAVNPFGAHEVWAILLGYSGSASETGVYRSTSADLTGWEKADVPWPYTVYSVNFDPTQEGIILLGNDGGFLSLNGGSDWTPFYGLPVGGGVTGFQAGVKDFAIDPLHPQTLYAATQHGIFKSSDGGATWSDSNHLLGGVQPYSLSVSPFDPFKVYAATMGAEMIHSPDGGRTWAPLNLPWLGNDANVAADAFQDRRLYAGTINAVAISQDDGQSYREIPLPLPPGVVGTLFLTGVSPDPDQAGSLLAYGAVIPPDGSAWGGALYLSSDSGEHWDWAAPETLMRVRAVARDPAAPQVIYVGTDDGLWKSSDGGQSWRKLSGAGATGLVNVLAVHPTNHMVFSNSDPNTFCASKDGGETWGESLLQQPVTALAFLGGRQAVLYAGTLRGLYRSPDLGESWQTVPGLGAGTVSTLASVISGQRAVIYVGMSSGAAAPSRSRTPRAALTGGGVFHMSGRFQEGTVFLPLVSRKAQ